LRDGDITLVFEDRNLDTPGLLTRENLLEIYNMEEKNTQGSNVANDLLSLR